MRHQQPPELPFMNPSGSPTPPPLLCTHDVCTWWWISPPPTSSSYSQASQAIRISVRDHELGMQKCLLQRAFNFQELVSIGKCVTDELRLFHCLCGIRFIFREISADFRGGWHLILAIFLTCECPPSKMFIRVWISQERRRLAVSFGHFLPVAVNNPDIKSTWCTMS